MEDKTFLIEMTHFQVYPFASEHTAEQYLVAVRHGDSFVDSQYCHGSLSLRYIEYSFVVIVVKLKQYNRWELVVS